MNTTGHFDQLMIVQISMGFLIPERQYRPDDDPIFALNTEAQRRRNLGESIINATVGALLDDEAQLLVLPSVIQTLREVSPLVAAAYAPIGGPPHFLSAVIRELFPDATENAIAVATPGGTGALSLAVTNFLESGQSILTSSYYWSPYSTIADEHHRVLETFDMFTTEGSFNHNAFEQKLSTILDQQHRALLLINFPCHNPTGYSLREDEWKLFCEVIEANANKGPITLLMDVAYAHYSPNGFLSCVNPLKQLMGKIMILFAWSASKSFTQYGARVGAIVATHPDISQLKAIRSALSYSCRGIWSNCNAAGMAAVTRLLTDPILRSQIASERAEFKALLDRRVNHWNALATHLCYPRYDGGFFTTVFCHDAASAALRLQEEGIFVVPMRNALRIALCSVAEKDVPRLVERITHHVNK